MLHGQAGKPKVGSSAPCQPLAGEANRAGGYGRCNVPRPLPAGGAPTQIALARKGTAVATTLASPPPRAPGRCASVTRGRPASTALLLEADKPLRSLALRSTDELAIGALPKGLDRERRKGGGGQTKRATEGKLAVRRQLRCVDWGAACRPAFVCGGCVGVGCAASTCFARALTRSDACPAREGELFGPLPAVVVGWGARDDCTPDQLMMMT